MSDRSTIDDEVWETLVEFCAELIAMRQPKAQCKKLIYEAYGRKVNRETVERILNAARARIAAVTLTDKELERKKAFAFYEAVIASDDASMRDRLAAQEGINQLLGLPARFTGADGPVEAAQKVRELLTELEGDVETVEGPE